MEMACIIWWPLPSGSGDQQGAVLEPGFLFLEQSGFPPHAMAAYRHLSLTALSDIFLSLAQLPCCWAVISD